MINCLQIYLLEKEEGTNDATIDVMQLSLLLLSMNIMHEE